jgi:hypothetical protein
MSKVSFEWDPAKDLTNQAKHGISAFWKLSMRLMIRDASSPRISLTAQNLKSDISVLANAAMGF